MIRKQRLEELLRKEVSNILRGKVSDPRIGFVTITDVKVSPDLENASVYVSVFGEEKKKEETMQGLFSATKFIRGELGTRLNLRLTPAIHFVNDNSLERGSNILAVISKLENAKRIQKNKATSKKS